jgi:hypothetical protein
MIGSTATTTTTGTIWVAVRRAAVATMMTSVVAARP